MICSSVDDNWMRVEIMHSVAKNFFDTANQIKKSHGGIKVLIDLRHYMYEQKESCIVGMLKAWSVVTLESLANHAIAENLNNKTVAISAIEYPGSIISKSGLPSRINSELSKKLIIINDGYCGIEQLTEIAQEIVDIRNLIVHDKPYEYTDLGDGDFKIEEFRARGNSEDIRNNYESLKIFYSKCDQIANFIVPKIQSTYMFNSNINFSNLLQA